MRETSLPSPTCFPMDGTVDVDVMGMGGVDVDVDVDEKYDGKHLDRLWRWTGLITAAKMGVSRLDDGALTVCC